MEETMIMYYCAHLCLETKIDPNPASMYKFVIIIIH